jgi:hypothetical protein
MINALDIVAAGADEVGPRVVSAAPEAIVTGPVDRVRLSFSEAIDPTTFTLSDVVLLEGPAGAIAPLSIDAVASGELEIVFAPQNTPGLYRLAIGPDIADGAGNAMDQDQDGILGENPDDRFETAFTLEGGPEYVARFDFGTAVSPVAEGYVGHPANHRYSTADGYGWLSGQVYGISRNTGTDLTRDFNYTKDAIFALDLASGEYDVIVTLGDMATAHDLMGVFLEGVQVDTVTTARGETAAGTYRVNVSDGQLQLRLEDQGGSDAWVMINALDVIVASGNTVESASAMAFGANWGLTYSDPSHADVISRVSSTVVHRRAFDKAKTLDLLISQLSTSPRSPARDAPIAARDQAISELFDRHRVEDVLGGVGTAISW